MTTVRSVEKLTVGRDVEFGRGIALNGAAAGKLPPLLYFEGLSRYRKPGEIIHNDVYYVQPK